MLNHVDIMGRLVRDPELRYTQTNTPVCTFSIACERDFSAGGEKQTDFFNVTAWRTTAEFVSKYFAKGRMIALTGRLQSRSYDDKDGNKRTVIEIVADSVYFGDSNRDGGAPRANTGSSANTATRTWRPETDQSTKPNGYDPYNGMAPVDDDGDLPF